MMKLSSKGRGKKKQKESDADIICKKRSKKFDEDECDQLIIVMRPYSRKIDCKQTDSVHINKKNKYWAEVTSKFNSTAKFKRSEQELRTKWENLKKSARREGSTCTKEAKKTGGGENASDPVSSIAERVIATNRPLYMPPTNPHDSDYGHVNGQG
jgi:hypothetical protein